MISSRHAAVVIAGLVLLGAAGPAAAVSTSVEIQAASPASQSETLSFSFTPASNQTLSAPSRLTDGGGDVVFEFERWDRSDGTDGGTSTSWQALGGEEYTVEYSVDVDSATTEGTYASQADISGSSGTVHSEQLETQVDVLEPSFGVAPSPAVSVELDAITEDSVEKQITVPIQNTGDGFMQVEFVQLSNTPSEISLSSDSALTDISAGETESVTFTVDIGAEAEGTYQFDVTVTDSLDDTQTFTTQLTVDKVLPAFGSVDTQTAEVVFADPDGQGREVEVEPTVPNEGDGTMQLRSIELEDPPRGIDVESASLSGDQVAANADEPVSFSVAADNFVQEGSYRMTAVLTDSLDNTVRFPVTLTVRRPPVVGTDNGRFDLGGVLVGTEKTARVAVSEVGDTNPIDGMTVRVRPSQPRDGELSVAQLRRTSVRAGETEFVDVSVSASESADQDDVLRWDVTLTPNADDADSQTIPARAEVLYPPRLEELALEGVDIEFDRARPTSDYETTTTVEFANGGDLTMEVQDISAEVAGSTSVTATVTKTPASVNGLSSGSATVQVTAQPDAPEETSRLEVTVQTAEGGTETITREVTVNHQIELSTSATDVEFGELSVTTERTRAVEVTEELGYETVSGLTVEPVAGPESYLQITSEPPSTIEPGESDQLVFTLEFSPDAELYRQYAWAYKLDGDNVDPRIVNVTARPRPLSFGEVKDDLSAAAENGAFREPVATGVEETLVNVETRLRENKSVSGDTLSISLSMARATLLYLDALSAARTAQESGNFKQGQRHLTEAAVARDQVVSAVEQISPQLRSPATRAVRAANQSLDETVASQRAHYEDVLGGDPSVAERARAQRSLAQLAAITGDRETAARRRGAATNATDTYLRLVEDAATARAQADTTWQSVKQNATVVLAGQPLVLNPARYDAVTDRLKTIDDRYASAIDQHRRAGTDRVEPVTQRRDQVAFQAQLVSYSLLAAAGVYGLGAVGVISFVFIRGLRYVRETRRAAVGDFLLN